MVHRSMPDMPPDELIRQIRKFNASLPVILLAPVRDAEPLGADYAIPSHEPQVLLDLLDEIMAASGPGVAAP